MSSRLRILIGINSGHIYSKVRKYTELLSSVDFILGANINTKKL